MQLPKVFDVDKLNTVLSQSNYKIANPYPHIVLDNFFLDDELKMILREWPLRTLRESETHNDGTYVRLKVATSPGATLPHFTSCFLQTLNQPTFLNFLEKLTGISGLIPDPYFFGGGLHETFNTGRLAIHADFNKHFKYKLDRRINMLIYLNEGWRDDNGGQLELWDAQMNKCEVSVTPIFNRTVIFSTTSTSFHGQPNPVRSENSRKSIALYYYSNGRPEENESKEHSTLWKERPNLGF